MNKQILMDYIDACEQVKETEQEIRKLKRKKSLTVHGNVKGSNPNFPYQEQHFHISGTEFDYNDDRELYRYERLLQERRGRAEKVKVQVEEWMNTIPIRMQRIIKYKVFDGLSWEQTAAKMGRKATGDSVRKEFTNFLKGI